MFKTNIKSLGYAVLIPTLLIFSACSSENSEPTPSPTVKVIVGVQGNQEIVFDKKLYTKPYCSKLDKAAVRIYEGGTESIILKKIEPTLVEAKTIIDKTKNVQLKDTYNTSLNIIQQGRYPDLNSENVEERYAWRKLNMIILQECGFSLDLQMALN